MSEMTSVERVLCVCGTSSRIGFRISNGSSIGKVREAILPGCTMEEFTVRMGLGRDPDRPGHQEGADRRRNASATNGAWSVETTAEEHGFPVEGPIKTLDDLRNYRRPIRMPPAATTAWSGWSIATRARWRSAST